MHADCANLIMRYLSIRWFDLETRNTVATFRIRRLFLWYAMNELMLVMQRQNDACDARIKWRMWCKNDFFFFGYMNGHSSHLPWLNHGWKIECLRGLDWYPSCDTMANAQPLWWVIPRKRLNGLRSLVVHVGTIICYVFPTISVKRLVMSPSIWCETVLSCRIWWGWALCS